MGERLSAAAKKHIAEGGIRVFVCDAIDIARKLGPRKPHQT